MNEGREIPSKGYSRIVNDPGSFFSKINKLPHLTIELTDRCNNDCRHCYINRSANDLEAIQKEMSTEFIKNLIHQAANLGCFDLRFTGGEPLLRKDFFELYRFSRKSGFKVLIFTNARLITPELVDLFKTLPPGQPIGVTVYGMSSGTYENVTGVKGSFNEFRRGIRLLVENQIDFALQMAVLPDNRQDILAYEEWVKTLFAGIQKPVYITNFLQRARHDLPEKSRLIKEMRRSAQETVDLFARIDGYYRELYDFCVHFTGWKSDKLFTCGFGKAICIDAYGFAQGCQLLRHPDTLFSLHAGTLEDALRMFFPAFHNRHALHPLFLSRCACCCLRGLCEQCPAQSWMEHGTLDTPAEFQCQLAHAHARRIGLLSAGENGWEIVDWQSRLDQVGSNLFLTNN